MFRLSLEWLSTRGSALSLISRGEDALTVNKQCRLRTMLWKQRKQNQKKVEPNRMTFDCKWRGLVHNCHCVALQHLNCWNYDIFLFCFSLFSALSIETRLTIQKFALCVDNTLFSVVCSQQKKWTFPFRWIMIICKWFNRPKITFSVDLTLLCEVRRANRCEMRKARKMKLNQRQFQPVFFSSLLSLAEFWGNHSKQPLICAR